MLPTFLSSTLPSGPAALGAIEGVSDALIGVSKLAAVPNLPVADHLADKLCAIISTYGVGGSARASIRIKDLVDIAPIASTQRVSGPVHRSAIVAITTHRGLSIPDEFAVPDEASWRRGFPRVPAYAPGHPLGYDEAVALAGALLNPVPASPLEGEWDRAPVLGSEPRGKPRTDPPASQSLLAELTAGPRGSCPSTGHDLRHTNELVTRRFQEQPQDGDDDVWAGSKGIFSWSGDADSGGLRKSVGSGFESLMAYLV